MIETLLLKELELEMSDETMNGVPADQMSRQVWQDRIESFVEQVREIYLQPAFGLSQNEISIHYHLALREFTDVVKRKIGTVG